jgi:hypothetical protein
MKVQVTNNLTLMAKQRCVGLGNERRLYKHSFQFADVYFVHYKVVRMS